MNARFLVSIIISITLIFACGNLVKDKKSEQKNETEQSEKSAYEKGLHEMDNKYYTIAKNYFEQVPKEDSNYTDAQNKIKLCEEKQKEIDKEEGERLEKEKKERKQRIEKKSALEKKYNRIFGGSGWLHEKQNKLLDQGFTEYNSGFEEAPDGSTQVAMYYKKFVDGFYVHVRLQYAYASDYHYVKVWVE